jgi:ribose 5-phosphate isomerase A
VVLAIDRAKLVERLGSSTPLPIAVIPFGLEAVLRHLGALPGRADLRREADGRPFETDDGHWIVDYACAPLPNPFQLDAALHRIPGIVEHGLFLGLASRVIVGGDSVEVLDRS